MEVEITGMAKRDYKEVLGEIEYLVIKTLLFILAIIGFTKLIIHDIYE